MGELELGDMDLTKVHSSWLPLFEAQKNRLNKIAKKLKSARVEGQTIYPKPDDILRVFEMNLFEIKLVLLGQDPYIQERFTTMEARKMT